jgi:hypothetical protein
MGDMKVALALVVILPLNLHSQSKKGQTGNSGQASLNITATVEPSVSFTTNPEGKKELLVVNPPTASPATEPSKHAILFIGKSTVTNATVMPAKERQAEVIFAFPEKTKEFDVTHQTVVMNVTEAGKAVRRPVNVTTVVAR